MTRHSIYIDDEHLSVDKALEIMTDAWMDEGNYCTQTVIDLRDVLKSHIITMSKITDELDKFREVVKSAHDVLLTVVNDCNLFYKESADVDNYIVDECYSVLDKMKQLRY